MRVVLDMFRGRDSHVKLRGPTVGDIHHAPVLKAGHPGSCLSCMFICIMLDTGFCGWFYFLSFFLLYTLASML